MKGSWFILALCESLARHAHHSELHHVLLQVNADVATITSNTDDKRKDKCKEAPEFRRVLSASVCISSLLYNLFLLNFGLVVTFSN